MNEFEIEQMRLTAMKFREKGIFTAQRPLSEAEMANLIGRESARSTRARKVAAQLAALPRL